MQDSSEMWTLLCEELQSKRGKVSREEQSEAARHFEAVAKQVFGNNVPRMMDALEIAGDVHHAIEEIPDALRCYDEALKLAGSAGAHNLAVRLGTKLAMLYEGLGDARQAIHFYTKAVEACDLAHLQADIPTLLNNLARQKRHSGDFPGAEKDYLRALAQAERVYGRDHPEVSLIANNLGVAYTERGEYSKAEEMHMRALSIREVNFGGNHPDVAQSLGNIAVLHHARNDYRKAERYYRGAMEIYSNFRSADDPEFAQIRENFSRLPANLAHTRRINLMPENARAK